MSHVLAYLSAIFAMATVITLPVVIVHHFWIMPMAFSLRKAVHSHANQVDTLLRKQSELQKALDEFVTWTIKHVETAEAIRKEDLVYAQKWEENFENRDIQVSNEIQSAHDRVSQLNIGHIALKSEVEAWVNWRNEFCDKVETLLKTNSDHVDAFIRAFEQREKDQRLWWQGVEAHVVKKLTFSTTKST